MGLKLFVFHGGPAPRRVVVYLHERNLPNVEIVPCTMSAPQAPAEAVGKPSGAVPLLHDPDSDFTLHESLAVTNYLEELAIQQGAEPMDGRQGGFAGRAKVNEMLGLIETVAVGVEFAPVFGYKIFSQVVDNQQSAGGVRFLLKLVHQNLDRIEEYAAPVKDDSQPWLVDIGQASRQVSIADCFLFGILQYARHMFGWDLTASHPRLQKHYHVFEKRESAAVPEGCWLEQLTAMTKDFIEY